MAVGTCFCKKIQIEYTNPPITSALCYCLDCRRLTGSLCTYSFVFKSSDLTITGPAKEISKTSDSGNHIKNYFCPDCGTPLYGLRINPSGDADNITIVRAGIFNDMEKFNHCKPAAELYIGGRVNWLCPVEGAAQLVGMLPLASLKLDD